MRPQIKFLDDALIERIVSEARDVLCSLGITLHNEGLRSLLGDHGAEVDTAEEHVTFTPDIIDEALKTAPSGFKLYDVSGEEALDLSGDKVHFTPGSAAIRILDAETETIRNPTIADYVRYAKLVDRLPFIASQSTCMIPAEVPGTISDSLRLYLSLLYGRKPVVTGTFTIEAFEVMKEMQVAIRGSEQALAEKPLTIYSACPTSPLKFSDVTSQNVADCARYGIPVEFIAMPLAGFMSPVTLVGTLVAHTAETLSGVVLSQLSKPGAPMLYGGSPAIFDIRYETTPMGAIETQMLDCAYGQIGKYLDIPTQAYIGLSDSKRLDAQAGQETGMGCTLAALAGINNVSGPGMLDFESCFSLEKLVMDNELCGMALRMVRGIEPKEDFPARPHFEELLRDKHLLIAKHTRKHLRDEHLFVGPVINRANYGRWREEGSTTLMQRARAEVDNAVGAWEPSPVSEEVKQALRDLMSAEAAKVGFDQVPDWRM